MRTILTVPGIGSSGPEHWQSMWERQHPRVLRIEQSNWDQPRCADWVETIEATLSRSEEPPVLVAHSLGCLAVIHWASRSSTSVDGIVLVATPDPAGPNFPKTAQGFAPIPHRIGDHRVLMIDSDDDPYGNLTLTKALARDFNARHIELHRAGHINAASGLADWQAGWKLVAELARLDR